MKHMFSCWSTACRTSIRLDRLSDSSNDYFDEPFCVYVVKLFCQLSAMSMMRLHVDDTTSPTDWTQVSGLQVRLTEKPTGDQSGGWLSRVRTTTLRTGSDPAAAASTPDAEPMQRPSVLHHMEHATSSHQLGTLQRSMTMSHLDRLGAEHQTGSHSSNTLQKARAELNQLFSQREVEFLKMAPDPGKTPRPPGVRGSPRSMPRVPNLTGACSHPLPTPAVQCMANRIITTIATRQLAGGVMASRPYMQVIMNHLEAGVASFEAAKQLKEVPMPFAYVQVNALLLFLFVLIVPIAIGVFSESILISVAASVSVVGGFTAMWLVANELEDPFGTDNADLPMILYHEYFCATLQNMLTKLPEDVWTAPEGPWMSVSDAKAKKEQAAAEQQEQSRSDAQSAEEAKKQEQLARDDELVKKAVAATLAALETAGLLGAGPKAAAAKPAGAASDGRAAAGLLDSDDDVRDDTFSRPQKSTPGKLYRASTVPSMIAVSPSDTNSGNASGSARALEGTHQQLPAEWEAARDPTSGGVYYFHRVHGHTSWERPLPARRRVRRARKEGDASTRREDGAEYPALPGEAATCELHA